MVAPAACLTKMPVHLYVVACETANHYYVGLSSNVDHRFRKHRTRKGAAFTRKHGAKSVEVLGLYDTVETALAAEKACVLELRERTGGVVAGSGQVWSRRHGY